jgi:hypothetical protein
MGDAAPRRLRRHRLHGVSSEVKGGINGRLIRNRSCLRAAFFWDPRLAAVFLERCHPRCPGLALSGNADCAKDVCFEGVERTWRRLPRFPSLTRRKTSAQSTDFHLAALARRKWADEAVFTFSEMAASTGLQPPMQKLCVSPRFAARREP